MARFIARVELLGIGSNEDAVAVYEELHNHMRGARFEPFHSSPSLRNQLPQPEGHYIGEFDASLTEARAAVDEAVKRTRKRAHVFVVQQAPNARVRLIDASSRPTSS